jgi:hypothetical protein
MDVASILAGAMASSAPASSSGGAGGVEPSPFKRRAATATSAGANGGAAGEGTLVAVGRPSAKKRALTRELSLLKGDQSAEAVPPMVSPAAALGDGG